MCQLSHLICEILSILKYYFIGLFWGLSELNHLKVYNNARYVVHSSKCQLVLLPVLYLGDIYKLFFEEFFDKFENTVLYIVLHVIKSKLHKTRTITAFIHLFLSVHCMQKAFIAETVIDASSP